MKLAKDLPDLATIDSALYGDDLKLAEHAIKLSVAYANLIQRAKDAFEADKDRIAPQNITSTAENLALAGIPDAFDKTARSLGVKEHFLNVQAANFGSIASRIADSRRDLGGIAILSQALQTPALQAIDLYNIYQAKRLREMGRNVNAAIMDELRLNETALMGRGNLTRDVVMDEFNNAQSQIKDQLTQLITMLTCDVDERVHLAEKIEADVTDLALGKLPAPESDTP